jgi:hypothetical protein
MEDGWGNNKARIQAFSEKILKAGWATQCRIDENGVLFHPTPAGRDALEIFSILITRAELQTDFELGLLALLAFPESPEPPENLDR